VIGVPAQARQAHDEATVLRKGDFGDERPIHQSRPRRFIPVQLHAKGMFQCFVAGSADRQC
jgi:hypothetical protein